jgi:hypothetical protein
MHGVRCTEDIVQESRLILSIHRPGFCLLQIAEVGRSPAFLSSNGKELKVVLTDHLCLYKDSSLNEYSKKCRECRQVVLSLGRRLDF